MDNLGDIATGDLSHYLGHLFGPFGLVLIARWVARVRIRDIEVKKAKKGWTVKVSATIWG